ncbi:MAG TPA: cytochrome d ubiquinol oxidase subunit II, partial [Flavisolibacter sp.]|nr:cytochrome d ubiquinol oxidase subunit II [Flavisolibacter sp.]
LFKISSFITPGFLGIILGAMIRGSITLSTTTGFYEKFILPWLNPFCFVMGLFSIFIFAYISAVFLVGETRENNERIKYSLLSKRFMIITLLLGMLVFFIAQVDGLPLFTEFIHSGLSVSMFLLTFILCPVIWFFLNREHHKTLQLRIAIGIQISSILIGWFYIQFPILIRIKEGDDLTFYNTQAPAATLEQLLIALGVGLILIVPSFIYLFKVFKIKA